MLASLADFLTHCTSPLFLPTFRNGRLIVPWFARQYTPIYRAVRTDSSYFSYVFGRALTALPLALAARDHGWWPVCACLRELRPWRYQLFGKDARRTAGCARHCWGFSRFADRTGRTMLGL